MLNYSKYRRFETISFKERTWPNNSIKEAPIWCSIDLVFVIADSIRSYHINY